MKIYLDHEYKYDLEQIILALFPNELPEFSNLPYDFAQIDENSDKKFIISNLTISQKKVTVNTRISLDGETGTKTCVGALPDPKILPDPTRIIKHTIKRSVYLAAKPLLSAPLPWGALTGIRPSKVASMALDWSNGNPVLAKNILKNSYYVSEKRAGLALQTAFAAKAIAAQLPVDRAALYVSIPFCPGRCNYCSFVSHSIENAKDLITPYLDALCAELEHTGKILHAKGRRLNSIYIGGGTPTVLTADQLAALMQVIGQSFDIADLEYTVEAGRADTITLEKLEVLANAGVNRISVNPQSLDPSVLKSAGRNTTPEQIIKALELALSYPQFAVNADLIAGLQDDTPESFERSLARVIALKPHNITVHSLAYKKAAAIYKDKDTTGGCIEKMLNIAGRLLAKAEYAPYYLYKQKYTPGGFENVGYALNGKVCRYNVYMMEELCTVIGAGAGAVTKIVAPGKIERIFNYKYPYEYINNADKTQKGKEQLAERWF